MGIRLDDLDLFFAVAASGGVRRASMDLDVPQPTITKAIKRLESEVGFELFERGPRGMRLTEVARRFQGRAQLAHQGLAEAVREAAAIQLGSLSVLRIGASTQYIQQLVAPVAMELLQGRPLAQIRLNLGLGDALLRGLSKGDYDLVVCASTSQVGAGFLSESLFDDDIVIVARSGHPLHRRKFSLAALSDYRWILPGPGAMVRRALEERLAEAGAPPPVVALEVSESVSQIWPMLPGTDFLMLFGEAATRTPQARGLTTFSAEQARFQRRIALYRRSDEVSPIVDRCVELLRTHSRRLYVTG
jgi:DNA-binding transcriptional LysR family regulator